jgi:predicted nucleic acid-binding protein
MARIILLDAAPVGLICHPKAGHEIKRWLAAMEDAAATVALPEVADFEVRRELLRLGGSTSVGRLDFQKARLYYLPITTEVMLIAAELWAMARRQGRPGADPRSLDGDVIIAAQARLLRDAGNEVVVATDNLSHFELFVEASRWQDIK